jgi:hypothetical protein
MPGVLPAFMRHRMTEMLSFCGYRRSPGPIQSQCKTSVPMSASIGRSSHRGFDMDFFRDFVPRSAPLPNPDPFKRAQGTLNVGDNLYSATRAFMLTMQSDGNLVLYALDDDMLSADITRGKYTIALWSSRTNGRGGTHCDMQDDGNCVIKNSANQPLWSSGTLNHPGTFLRCQDDGNVVFYGPGGSVVSAINTDAGSHSLARRNFGQQAGNR